MIANCYTFYSYKGGSGRTTALLNTTKHLAEILNATPEHPILLIDSDLESAGLTYFFKCQHRFTSRIKGTIHAEAFLNATTDFVNTWNEPVTFDQNDRSREACTELAERLEQWYRSESNDDFAAKVQGLFRNVAIEYPTKLVFGRILTAHERKNSEALSERDQKDDALLRKLYPFDKLLSKLERIEKDGAGNVPDRKRQAIVDFLPADRFVDVSEYFALPYGTIRFVGVDVHFDGIHSSIDANSAASNKNMIATKCGAHGFSTVIFDCSAGVQNTAHILNQVSDVLVYCMRPTFQFISGTQTQLQAYTQQLENTMESKKAMAKDLFQIDKPDIKTVILLPTAVPAKADGAEILMADSFERIQAFGRWYSFVDAYFCTHDTALGEVALFKWREHILGTPLKDPNSTLCAALAPYAGDVALMPEDAQKACGTYHKLAEKLLEHSLY